MRRAPVILFGVVLFLLITCTAWAAPRVVFDGMPLTLDQAPVIEQGRVLVPLRAVSEALGATVEWNGTTRTVIIVKAPRTVHLTIGLKTAYHDAFPVSLDVPPRIVNGRTLVPLRFLSEALGAGVSWDGNTRTVTVTSDGKESTAVKIDESHAGGRVTLTDGDILEVVLEGNLTTGYGWETASVDPLVLEPVGEPVFQADSVLIGAGGKMIIKFRAAGPGQTDLKLHYRRPWEKDIAPLKTFETTVVVTSPQNPATIKGLGEAFQFDLNGDGTPETIRFHCLEGGDRYTLSVNDVYVTGEGNNLDGWCTVINIDATDKFSEIAVSESGPSSDDATTFYYYDGGQIIRMGKIEGSFSNFLKIDGSGWVETKTRGKTIHTWFYPDFYKLSSAHLLEKVPRDLCEMNHKVTVIREFPLQKSREDTSIAMVLKPGEEAVFVSSDDKNWCLVQVADGRRGWFSYEGYNKISGVEELRISDIFEGLCYAD
jgi:predicted secreted protein